MKMRFCTIILTVVGLTYFAAGASAEEWEKYDKPVPTKVVVRVLSHGAKAMSKHTGALVVIRDARTGKELDKGAVEGSTGDDIALMRAGYPRLLGKTGLLKGEKGMIFLDSRSAEKMKEKGWKEPDPYFDLRDQRAMEELKPALYESNTDTAMFETIVNISKPTQMLIEVYGPLMPQHSMASAVTTTWLFPGEDVGGEGIVLELRGLIVDAVDSLREKEINVNDAKDGIEAPFYMRMMCGCPIAPSGRFGISWEAERYNITTQAYYKGRMYYEDTKTSDKLYTDVSTFKTVVPLPKDLPEGQFGKERVKVRIMASQPELANYGMDEFNVYLSR